MTSTALWQVQQAIFNRLNDDIALKAKITGVYDYVPENTDYPYCVIGNPIVNPFESKTSYRENIPWTLHCYNDGYGKKGTFDILNLMIQALTKEPWVVEGFKVNRFKIEPNIRVISPADVGFPYQGVLQVRFYISN